MKQYTLVGFRKSHNPGKKYDALLKSRETLELFRIPFGDVRYEQYEDKTPLGLYSHKDHFDKSRRANFRKRHAHNVHKGYFSPAYFSTKYLW